MKRRNRYLVDLLVSRIEEKSPLIQVMVGPRQVGKTTALKTALGKNGVYRSADYPTPLSYEVLFEWWDEAKKDPSRLLAIDEVQKIPQWSEIIKKRWDENPDLKLIVTGSSSLLVEKGLKETLAGRFELIRAEHWNYNEAKQSFGLSLEEYVEYGCYPGTIRFLKDLPRWGDYVRDAIIEPALGRDLLQLHPVENPALLRQVFGAAVSLPAQIVSLQKIQGNLQGKGSIPTLSHYLRLLSDAFLVTAIQKYSPSSHRSKKSIPKLIIHDNALPRAFERPIHKELSPERLGRYFENAVGSRFIEAGWETYYWKHRNHEVDYVVVGPENQHWAVEVKSTKVTQKELKGLFEFQRQYPIFEPCLVSYTSQEIEGVRTLDPEMILSLSRVKGSCNPKV